ncbi:MAG: FAD-binding oxidoreductase [Pseudomonadota bacterium]
MNPQASTHTTMNMTDRAKPPTDHAAADAIADIVGPKGVVSVDEWAPYLTEWRGRWTGKPAMIVAPATTQEVSEVVKICSANNIAITPQGGNTGLVGGQIPFDGEILLTLKRMRAVRDVSPLNNTMTVEAGVTLAEAQDIAAAAGRLFPLSIGAEGTCQIGGVVSTNAGGVNVLRYGNTRDLVLGLEAVTPDGRIWNSLKRLRKDNTGYDLKHLLIGGEGTLGVITAAVLKLFPAPAEKVTAFAGLKTAKDAVALLSLAQELSGGAVTSFEFMSRICVELSAKHIPGVRDPLEAAHAFYALMEFSSGEKDALRTMIERLLSRALEQELIQDATIAENQAQTDELWRMRHAMSEAITHESFGARHDVSVATIDIPAFLDKADAAVKHAVPAARIVAYGHLGDGNVHYDVIGSPGAPRDAIDHRREDIEEAVYDVIASFDGSISAEHGVGRARRDSLAKRKSAVEIDMMRAVKAALDPKGIMNPGKML